MTAAGSVEQDVLGAQVTVGLDHAATGGAGLEPARVGIDECELASRSAAAPVASSVAITR